VQEYIAVIARADWPQRKKAKISTATDFNILEIRPHKLY